MNKPDFLPFENVDITESHALEAVCYLTQLEIDLGRPLLASEVTIELTGEYNGATRETKTQKAIHRRVSRLAGQALGPIRYDSSQKLIEKIQELEVSIMV